MAGSINEEIIKQRLKANEDAALDKRIDEALKRLRSFMKPDPANGRIVVLYFDEVHSLIDWPVQESENYSVYDALCSVLSSLKNTKVFSIFLSTSSHVSGLAPPRLNIQTSFRPADGEILLPPFVELPFDCYPKGKRFMVEGSITLTEVCNVSHLSQFGRPLYVSVFLFAEVCS